MRAACGDSDAAGMAPLVDRGAQAHRALALGVGVDDDVGAGLGDRELDVGQRLVVDEGRGILPRADSPGLGLGLPLIAQMTESLEVHDRRGGGTEIRMAFALA